MRIILLNGPPNCGKDTAAQILQNELNAYHTKFSKALKEGAHALLGLQDHTKIHSGVVAHAPHDQYEEEKNTRLTDFFGLSPREFYIRLSEDFLKPACGESVFGKILLRELSSVDNIGGFGTRYAVISDSGFYGEALPIVNYFRGDNCLLIRLHRDGCNFDGDSRSYVNLHGLCSQVDVDNNSSIAILKGRLISVIEKEWGSSYIWKPNT